MIRLVTCLAAAAAISVGLWASRCSESRASAYRITGRVVGATSTSAAPYSLLFYTAARSDGAEPWKQEVPTDGNAFSFRLPERLSAIEDLVVSALVIDARGGQLHRFLFRPVPTTDILLPVPRNGIEVEGRIRGDLDRLPQRVELLALSPGMAGESAVRIGSSARAADGGFAFRLSHRRLVEHRGGRLLLSARAESDADGGFVAPWASVDAVLRADHERVDVEARLRTVQVWCPAGLPRCHLALCDGELPVCVAGRVRAVEGAAETFSILASERPLRCLVFFADYEPVVYPVEATGDTRLEVALPTLLRRRSVRGRVVDASGKGRSGVHLYLAYGARVAAYGLPSWPDRTDTLVTTDSDGRFAIDRLWDDRFVAFIEPESDRLPFVDRFSVAPGTPQVLTLPDSGSLTLSIGFDCEPDAAVAGAVRATLVHKSSGTKRELLVIKSPWRTVYLPTGEYWLSLQADPHWFGLYDVVIGPGENRVRVDLQPAPLATGRIVDGERRPMAGCIVRGASDSGAPWAWGVSDDAGAFEVLLPPWLDAVDATVLQPGEEEDQATAVRLVASRSSDVVVTR